MHVETCPFEGERIFFENAGGSLRLKSVVETSALYASYPDNQGRENDASKSLVKSIENGKAKMRLFFNSDRGDVIVGESCLLYTSPSPRDYAASRMPSSA